jgi:hypothetical protein
MSRVCITCNADLLEHTLEELQKCKLILELTKVQEVE